MSNDEILTVKETAALLKTTRQQVRKMIANEELPAVKIGREWRVLKAGIMEFFRDESVIIFCCSIYRTYSVASCWCRILCRILPADCPPDGFVLRR